VRQDGIFVTVPEDAQQALLLLAPQTGGDFGTLRATVRGKPGAFVSPLHILVRSVLGDSMKGLGIAEGRSHCERRCERRCQRCSVRSWPGCAARGEPIGTIRTMSKITVEA